MYQIGKKLVLVLATFMSITRAKKKKKALVKLLYIYYPIQFKKNINNIKALLDLRRKVNVINLIYT